MNIDAIFYSSAFWAAFAFSPGPFWILWMNQHTKENSLYLYKYYLFFIFFVFPTQSFILAFLINSFGALNNVFLVFLYFTGAIFIIYLAIKSIKFKIQKKEFHFRIKEMIIATFTNPKVYLTIPAGSLSATFFDNSLILNAFIFSTVFLIPINLMGSFFFYILAKISYKIALDKINYVTSSLLIFYGLFLTYEGMVLARELINS